MRRHDIVSGILLILSIIDFGLAAPVLVQERRQANVHVVHIPKDATTVLEKRVGEELAKLTEELLKNGEKPEELAGAHASGSAPPEPGHGPTNVAQVPEPNPATSTANPDPLMEPPSPSTPSSSMQYYSDDELDAYGKFLDIIYPPALSGADHDLSGAAQEVNSNPRPSADDSNKDYSNLKDPPPGPAGPSSSKEVGQAHEHMPLDAQPLAALPPSALMHPGPLADPDFPWYAWMNLPDSPKLAAPKTSGQGLVFPEDYMPPLSSEQSKPNPSLPETDPNFWVGLGLEDLLPKIDSPKDVGQAHESQVEHGLQPNAGPSNAGPSNAGPSNAGPSNSPPTTTVDLITGLGVNRPLPPPTDSERAAMGHQPPPRPTDLSPMPTEADPGSTVHLPSPGAGLSTIPEHEVGTPPPPQNLFDLWPPPGPEGGRVYARPSTPGSPTDPERQSSAQAPPVDLPSAVYTVKGKTKESRRNSGTARDVGNT